MLWPCPPSWRHLLILRGAIQGRKRKGHQSKVLRTLVLSPLLHDLVGGQPESLSLEDRIRDQLGVSPIHPKAQTP